MSLRCPVSPDGVCDPVDCMMGKALGCQKIATRLLNVNDESPVVVEIEPGPDGESPRLIFPSNPRYEKFAEELGLETLEDLSAMPAILEYGDGEDHELKIYEDKSAEAL